MFKTAATKIAHNSTLPSLGGNKDLKPLQDLITAEKTVLISLQKLSVDFAKASEALKTWGLGEGEDLGDTLSASTTILNHFSSALSQYASHEHLMRDNMKSIRTREEALDELRRRRRAVAAKAESAEKKLNKMSPEHKNLAAQTDILNKFRDEIRGMDSEIMSDEAGLGDYKRAMTRAWMALKFGGLVECCEKGTIAGEFGKLVIAEIPEDTTQPGLARSMYHGHPKVESLVAEAHRCVGQVVFSTVPSGDPRRAALPPPPNANSNDAYSEQHGFDRGSIGSGPNAGGPWSPDYGSSNNHFGDANPASSYAPSPLQSSGPVVYLDHSDNPPPGSPAGSGTFSTLSQPNPAFGFQSQTPTQTTRSVDDFGVTSTNTGISSGPLDSNSGFASGGRFATFPVKNRTGGSESGSSLAQLTGNAPLSLNTRHEPDQSFSSSIAEALGSPRSIQLHDDPVPTYEAVDRLYTPPPGPPPGAAAATAPSSLNPWNDGQRPHSQVSEVDVQLAYMTNPEDGGGDEHGVAGGKHVRFGEVSDVDDELEKRYAPQGNEGGGGPGQYQASPLSHGGAPPLQQPQPIQPQQHLMTQNGSPLPAIPSGSPIDTIGTESILSRGNDGSPASEPRPYQPQPQPHQQRPPQQRIPPPTMDDPQDERALNAAAAREVSRELDSLTFNPPSPINLSFGTPSASVDGHAQDESGNGRTPTASGFSQNQNRDRDQPPTPIDREQQPSPLAPPAPAFANRSVTPRPSVDTGTGSLPYPGAGSSPYSPGAAHTQPTQGSPYSQNQIPAYNPSQGQGRDRSSSPASPTSPKLASQPPAAPSLNLPDQNQSSSRSISPLSTNSPYRTPPEYPSPRVLGSSPVPPPMTKSSSSLNSPQIPPAGTRTISAAAFRRPQPRMSGDGGLGIGGPPLADTSPLSFKKRLPSSPYPPRVAIGSSLSRESSANPSPITGPSGRERSSSNSKPPPQQQQQQPQQRPLSEVDDDQYDYISAYVDNHNGDDAGAGADSGSPRAMDYGSLGRVSVANANDPGNKSPGYGEGRFATDLEGGLR